MTYPEQLKESYELGELSWDEYQQRLRNWSRLNKAVDAIHSMIKRPGSLELTSDEMRQREDRRQEIKSGLNITGQPVKPSYMYIPDKEEESDGC